jgi:polar amino acid transport system substrate-binding protein
MRIIQRVAMMVSAFVLTTGAGACGQVVDAARAALPEATRASGLLKVATSLQWPPFAFVGDNGSPDGIDVQLIKLLAGKLGLRPEFDDIKFPSIVPGVAIGRYDVGVDQIGHTAERAQVVAFLDYFNSGLGLLVRRGTMGVDVNHLCGRTLALTQGSSQVGVADTLSEACARAGNKPITKLVFPNSADTYMALANGRGDGFLSAKAVGVYIARVNDKLEMQESTLPDQISTSGIVMGKANTALHTALRLALEDALADGSYRKIMADHGVPEGTLTLEQIRNPPSF